MASGKQAFVNVPRFDAKIEQCECRLLGSIIVMRGILFYGYVLTIMMCDVSSIVNPACRALASKEAQVAISLSYYNSICVQRQLLCLYGQGRRQDPGM